MKVLLILLFTSLYLLIIVKNGNKERYLPQILFSKYFLIFLSMLILVFIPLDRMKYYISGESTFFNNILPDGIYPQYRFDIKGKFALYDKYDATLILNGLQIHNNPKQTVKSVLAYGHDKKNVVALVELYDKTQKYLMIIYKNDIYYIDPIRMDNKDHYTWIIVSDPYDNIYLHIRGLILAFFILLFLYMTIRIVVLKLLKIKAIDWK